MMTVETGFRGFSLIELLCVVGIMSILATVAIPLTELSRQRTKEEDLRRALREIRTALDGYKRLVDAGSIQRPADGSGYPPSLSVLEAGVSDARSPAGTKLYLMRRIPRDPFAPAEIPATETWALRSYASSAENPAPGKDVFDVYSKSTDTGLNGVPYKRW